MQLLIKAGIEKKHRQEKENMAKYNTQLEH